VTLSPRRFRERAGPALRFLISGGVVACIAVSITAGLTSAGVTFQLAFLVSYVTGITVHFMLHRHFTFADEAGFELSAGQQAGRWLTVVVAQYLLIAGVVAVIAALVDVAPLVVYLVVVACIAIANFVLLSRRVFHAKAAERVPPS
jgi:putative flippase GtrA